MDIFVFLKKKQFPEIKAILAKTIIEKECKRK